MSYNVAISVLRLGGWKKERGGCVRNIGHEHDFCQAQKAENTDPRTNYVAKYATARGHLTPPFEPPPLVQFSPHCRICGGHLRKLSSLNGQHWPRCFLNCARDCKRSLTVSKKAPTVSKKASSFRKTPFGTLRIRWPILQRMAKGGGIKGGIWKHPDFWIKGFQAFFKHFSGIFRGSGAMKNAWKFLDSRIRVFSGIFQGLFRLKRAFSNPPFCAPTLCHLPNPRGVPLGPLLGNEHLMSRPCLGKISAITDMDRQLTDNTKPSLTRR